MAESESKKVKVITFKLLHKNKLQGSLTTQIKISKQ